VNEPLPDDVPELPELAPPVVTPIVPSAAEVGADSDRAYIDTADVVGWPARTDQLVPVRQPAEVPNTLWWAYRKRLATHLAPIGGVTFHHLRWRVDELHLPLTCRQPLYRNENGWQAVMLPVSPSCATVTDPAGRRPESSLKASCRPTAAEVERMARSGPPAVYQAGGVTAGDHAVCIAAFREEHARLAWEWEQRLLELPSGGTDWREWLRHVAVGGRADGGRWRLSLIDSHVLIAGITGSGKSSVVWSVVAGAAPAIRAGVMRVHALDPKRLELAFGRGCFASYAAKPDDLVEALRRAVQTMEDRTEQLAGLAREFTPTPAMPLEVVLIDEIGYLLALVPDRKAQAEVKLLLNTLLNLGRAAGICVVGGLQDPRKETIESRDQWPTKVAMRLTREMARLVLGTEALEAGARCDLITKDMAGTAFVLEADAPDQPVQVRAFWVSDDNVKQLERALAPYVRPEAGGSEPGVQPVSPS
jgi:S-DNA-T family DNA segregation ATPase FtsK/SpoIIIE